MSGRKRAKRDGDVWRHWQWNLIDIISLSLLLYFTFSFQKQSEPYRDDTAVHTDHLDTMSASGALKIVPVRLSPAQPLDTPQPHNFGKPADS